MRNTDVDHIHFVFLWSFMVAAEIIAAEVCLDGSLADLIMDLPLSSIGSWACYLMSLNFIFFIETIEIYL